MSGPNVTDEHLAKVDLSKLPPNRPRTEANQLEILAGPILRYWGLADDGHTWRGSVMYVTRDAASDYGEFPPFVVNSEPLPAQPQRIYTVEGISFWRFDLYCVTHETQSVRITYQLGREHPEFAFWIPGRAETMRTMFYSCNGFSLKVDTAQFPHSLWDSVLAKHKTAGSPFHVMLGGGDQLYCDSINLVLPEGTMHHLGPLPHKEQLGLLMNRFYLHQYIEWFGRGYWKGAVGETTQSGWVEALATIPSLNIYDDHDIIDGYGTYRDHTMSSPVFKLLGEYAFRYYMLFQQCTNEKDDPKLDDPSWITTGRPGTYIREPARSIYARLGKSVAFLGLDCRTERRLNQVCDPRSYDAVFARLRTELAASPAIRHIYLMLGVPIAYPRMVWAENLMSSRLIAPIKWLSQKQIILKGLVNPFDGDVELLDDLNDHWCAKHHKHERNTFLRRLMDLQHEKSVRVTILTGDVHLCSVGIFESRRHTPPEHDARFMVCPISSAIVNTPPPSELASFMNRRNKTHYLGTHTKETNIPIFSVDTHGHAQGNKTMMAHRNYCILDPVLTGKEPAGVQYAGPAFDRADSQKVPKHDKGVKVVPGSVRMTLEVEIDSTAKELDVAPYEMYIPPLEVVRERK